MKFQRIGQSEKLATELPLPHKVEDYVCMVYKKTYGHLANFKLQ